MGVAEKRAAQASRRGSYYRARKDSKSDEQMTTGKDQEKSEKAHSTRPETAQEVPPAPTPPEPVAADATPFREWSELPPSEPHTTALPRIAAESTPLESPTDSPLHNGPTDDPRHRGDNLGLADGSPSPGRPPDIFSGDGSCGKKADNSFNVNASV